jgi:hypothetical protein
MCDKIRSDVSYANACEALKRSIYEYVHCNDGTHYRDPAPPGG